MSLRKEFGLDSETGSYLDEDGNTVSEVVGGGQIESVEYVGNVEIVEFWPYTFNEEAEKYNCEMCDTSSDTERGIKTHITQSH